MLLLIVLFSPIFHVAYIYLLSFGAELRAFTFYNTAVYTKSMRLINHFCSLCSVFILSTHQSSMPQYAMGCCRVFFFRILFLCHSRVFFLIVVLFDRFFSTRLPLFLSFSVSRHTNVFYQVACKYTYNAVSSNFMPDSQIRSYKIYQHVHVEMFEYVFVALERVIIV